MQYKKTIIKTKNIQITNVTYHNLNNNSASYKFYNILWTKNFNVYIYTDLTYLNLNSYLNYFISNNLTLDSHSL